MIRKLLISIQPQHLYNIIVGKKTLEIRKVIPKWVLEAIDRGEVVEALWYCTKAFPLLNYIDNKYELMDRKNHTIFHNIGMYEFYSEDIHLNGKIVAKSVISGVDRYVDYSGCNNNENGYECENEYMYQLCELQNELKKTCLTCDEIETYGNGKDLYALHIDKFEMIEPMGIDKVYKELYYPNGDSITPHICMVADEHKEEYESCQEVCLKGFELKHAPQSMMSVWVKEEI